MMKKGLGIEQQNETGIGRVEPFFPIILEQEGRNQPEIVDQIQQQYRGHDTDSGLEHGYGVRIVTGDGPAQEGGHQDDESPDKDLRQVDETL